MNSEKPGANLESLESVVEALLFASSEPVSAGSIAKAAELDEKQVKESIDNLKHKYKSENRGILILELDGSYQMCTNPVYYDYVRKLVQTAQKKPLSQAILETLAIIAYRQPVTKAQIEEIRGVNGDYAVNKLLELGLIVEKGRSDAPGRPILFATSISFLKHFGLSSLNDMPDIDTDYEQLQIEKNSF